MAGGWGVEVKIGLLIVKLPNIRFKETLTHNFVCQLRNVWFNTKMSVGLGYTSSCICLLCLKGGVHV